MPRHAIGARGQASLWGPTTIVPMPTICSRTSSGLMPGSYTRTFNASTPISSRVAASRSEISVRSSEAIV